MTRFITMKTLKELVSKDIFMSNSIKFMTIIEEMSLNIDNTSDGKFMIIQNYLETKIKAYVKGMIINLVNNMLRINYVGDVLNLAQSVKGLYDVICETSDLPKDRLNSLNNTLNIFYNQIMHIKIHGSYNEEYVNVVNNVYKNNIYTWYAYKRFKNIFDDFFHSRLYHTKEFEEE